MTQVKIHNADSHYSEWHYAEWRYAGSLGAIVIAYLGTMEWNQL
jgi:hypothetical protein